MLLDKLGQCVMQLARNCVTLFPRIPNADPSSQACVPCKDSAYKAITRVLHAEGKMAIEAAWEAMRAVRVPKAWMFNPDILGMFVVNIGGVDDDRWTAWWKTNALGREVNDGYQSYRAFFDRVVARHANNVRSFAQSKAAEAVKALLKPTPPASRAAIVDLAATFEARRAVGPVAPKLVTAEEHMVDVGDLQPDVAEIGVADPTPEQIEASLPPRPAGVEPTAAAHTPSTDEHLKTIGDLNSLPGAESFEPAPQAPATTSADETRATSGPAMERRLAPKGDAPARTKLARSRASVRVRKETPAPVEEQTQK